MVFFSGESTEKEPWTGNPFEFELRGAAQYQRYRYVSTGNHLQRYSANDAFLNVSLKNFTCYPVPLSLELEALEAFTHKQNGDIDSFKMTAIYPFRDDVGGDPFSVHGGLRYIQAFDRSLRDISSFHHGLYNGEIFISIGQEKARDIFWQRRWWVVFGLGAAEQGSAWGSVDIHAALIPYKRHELKFFISSLWGMGHKNLHIHSFKGYGNVAHASLDMGVGYTYHIDYLGECSFEYSLRPYAVNFPAYAQQFLLKFLVTFGL